jgi:hypothetical protein
VIRTLSLLSELKEIGERVDPSVLPQQSDVLSVLGALVYRVEHGADALDALADKDAQEVLDAFSGHVEPEPESAAAPVTAASAPPAALPAASATVPPTVADAPVDTVEDAAADDTLAELRAELRELRAEREDLRAQVAARRATAGATTVEHTGPTADPATAKSAVS